MLREFSRRDIPELLPLLERHFPEENALLGWQAPTYYRLIHRFYRWDARLILGFLSALGRSVYRFFVIEDDHRLAGTTLLTFTSRAGYVSTVMVDTPHRRRGYAKRMLAAAIDATRATGRRYLVLDVLATNAPARALYSTLGFRLLRRVAFLVRERPAPSAPGPAPPAGTVRSFRPRDKRALLSAASAVTPAAVAEVLPPEAGQFGVSEMVVRALDSVSEAWVAPALGTPQAFVRATVSHGVVAGHLTSPLLGPTVDDAAAGALLAEAVAWVDARGVGRIVSEVPDHNVRARRQLEALGFHEAFPVETLVLDL